MSARLRQAIVAYLAFNLADFQVSYLTRCRVHVLSLLVERETKKDKVSDSIPALLYRCTYINLLASNFWILHILCSSIGEERVGREIRHPAQVETKNLCTCHVRGGR